MQVLGDCPGNSPDAPGHVFCRGKALGLADLADAHLRAASAGHLENMSVGRGDFENTILVAKNFGGIQNFDGAVNHLDHLRPQGTYEIFEILETLLTANANLTAIPISLYF